MTAEIRVVRGSCLCGAIQYEFDEPYKWFIHCHCSMCRKNHGTFHGSIVLVEKSRFRFLSGEDAIVHYRSSKAFGRPFCNRCGSKVPDVSGAYAAIPAGTVDAELEGDPPIRIFVAHKSPMEVITDAATQFDAYPPGFGVAVSPPLTAEPSTPLRGSCLCGAVAFEIASQPKKIVQCHCSRCRRSRGTAHGVNTFVAQDQLRFIRGTDRIKTYRPPDAPRFSDAFCESCGSLVPVVLETLKISLVPVGLLDTPFAVQAATNIYVGSKAKWFTITNRFPQFEELPPRDKIPEMLLG